MGGATRAILFAGAAIATVGAGVGVAALLKAREARPVESGDPGDSGNPGPPPATVDGSSGETVERSPRPAKSRFSVPPPQQLARPEILGAMEKVKPKVHACFVKFRQPGILTVRMTIAASGRVTQARVEGNFAASDTARCVESAAKSAWFRSSKRPPATLTWPFLLR